MLRLDVLTLRENRSGAPLRIDQLSKVNWTLDWVSMAHGHYFANHTFALGKLGAIAPLPAPSRRIPRVRVAARTTGVAGLLCSSSFGCDLSSLDHRLVKPSRRDIPSLIIGTMIPREPQNIGIASIPILVTKLL